MSDIDRRTFIKGAGVATGVAATGAGARRLDLAPVQEADAIPPLVIGAGVAAGGVALGWALREFEVIGADDPPTGLTADALKQQVYQAFRTRHSNNKSTFVDNENIITGIRDTTYVDAKLAAIEALNAGKSQSEVQTAATTEIDNYETTVKKNFLKSWNETLNEWASFYQSLQDHSDVDPGTVISMPAYENGTPSIFHDYDSGNGSGINRSYTSIPTTYDMPDGSTFDVHHVSLNFDLASKTAVYHEWNAIENFPTENVKDHDPASLNVSYDGQSFDRFLHFQAWNAIWTAMDNRFTEVRDGIVLWIDSVYGQVQSGDISIEELITPRERAAMMTDDGKYPQAVADLLALNVPVDFEREATVSLDWHDDDVTLNGTLAITSPPDNLTPGTYDPQADSLGSVYLTYDIGAAEGVWTAYDDAKGVDGGTVEFESEPYEEVTYDIVTNYDETASVTAGDFTKGTDGSSNTVWTVDVSDQLDNSIAEISEVTYYTDTDETRYETIQMQGTFTIEKFTNTETGEQADSASFTSSEPQTDDNYVTQEEWNQLQQQNKELIEKYEDSQSGGGGLFPDAPDIPGWGIVVAVGGIALVLLGQSDDNGY